MSVYDFPTWRPRCEYCGQFVSYDSKHYPGRWDGYDTDPPEDVFYCPDHEKEAEAFRLKIKGEDR